MQHSPSRSIKRQKIERQKGFTLIGMVVSLAIAMVLVILVASEIKRQVDDSAAEGTGRYLMQIRGALVNLQLQHEAWLRGEDISTAPAGTYPTPPTLTWTSVPGAQVAHGGTTDLVALGLLPTGTPHYPTLGDTARFVLVRQGTCPGEDCQTSAYVHTCHPISDQRSLRLNTQCTTPVGTRAQLVPALLSQVLLAAGGYGGHDAFGNTHVRGPLMDVPRTWFDFGEEPGHVVLAASLDASPFGQFVRHGETRPVTLHNTLTVGETIQSNKGLLLNTAVASGTSCSVEGLYASTANKMLAVCVDGYWFSTTSHTITGTYSNLPHNAAVPALICPTGMTPWRHAAIQSVGVTLTGSDIHIDGTIGGTIQGSGSVNAAGSVSVTGSFAGTFQNSGSSYVRVAQSVSISGDRVIITPDDMTARAAVIQGCKS